MPELDNIEKLQKLIAFDILSSILEACYHLIIITICSGCIETTEKNLTRNNRNIFGVLPF